MPLYEYRCDACTTRFERIQKFSDPPVSTCPSCGGSVRKLLSSPAIQFKGTGWYITDYARKSSGDNGKGGKDQGRDAGKDSGKDTGKEGGKTEAASSGGSAGSGSDKSSSGGSSGETKGSGSGSGSGSTSNS